MARGQFLLENNYDFHFEYQQWPLLVSYNRLQKSEKRGRPNRLSDRNNVVSVDS
jgi:hypothetical protein